MSPANHSIVSYNDDHILFGNREQCNETFFRLTSLLEELSFTINVSKKVTPTTKAICVGRLIDTETSTMFVPPAKMGEIRHMIDNWAHKKSCTKQQFQSLLGSLLYISKCSIFSKSNASDFERS